MDASIEAVRAEQGSAKAAWHAVARCVGLSPRRVRSSLNGEVRAVPAWEADTLRHAARRAREERIARLERELAALRNERAARHATAATDGGCSPAGIVGVADLDRGAVRARRALPRPMGGSDRGLTHD